MGPRVNRLARIWIRFFKHTLFFRFAFCNYANNLHNYKTKLNFKKEFPKIICQINQMGLTVHPISGLTREEISYKWLQNILMGFILRTKQLKDGRKILNLFSVTLLLMVVLELLPGDCCLCGVE